MTILPGTTRLLCGKMMSMLYRNPATGVYTSGSFGQEYRIEEFSLTPKVNSAKYADSLSSGYMKNTSGVFEADGRFVILLTSEGSVNPLAAASNGVGVQVDDIIDIAFFTTLAQRIAGTPQIYGQAHINSVGKPFKTVDQKIAIPVDITMEGQWFEA